MRIAFIGQKGIPAAGGGVERYVEDVATRLGGHGSQAIVYTRRAYTPASLQEYKGVKLISLPSLHTKHLDAISHTFLATLHAIWTKVDVIHFQSIGPALLSWLPKLLRPRIIVVSTLQSRDYEHLKWGVIARFMLRLGERFMCRFSDELIVVSQPMKEYVAAEYGLNATLVPNGANLYDEVTSDAHLQAWGLSKQGYIVAISRLIRHKGLGCLIEAYRLMKTDKKLVIVGADSFTAEYANELKSLAAGDPNIIFTGNQTGEALAELYSHAAAFVQPSESEGLSLALLEAMSRRLPVVVSDIPANLDAAGEAGFVFATNNPAALRDQLEYVLSHPEEAAARGSAGRRRIEELYDWDILVERIMRVYQMAGSKAPIESRMRPATAAK